MRHLPDYHEFEYIAATPWPLAAEQQDWVDRVLAIELWLEHTVGPHWVTWAWHPARDVSMAAVAFRWEKHKGLFLLRWGR